MGSFLFSGDDVEKRIKVLSGGEKARVALAKTIVSKGNFLLLDEPTNHLDMHSVELLADALNKYEGSYILVSHDRYFISKTANKIWEITDHRIKEFKGGYHEWVAWNERMAKQNEGNAKSTAVAEKSTEIKSATPAPSEKKESQPEFREKQKQLQRQLSSSRMDNQLQRRKLSHKALMQRSHLSRFFATHNQSLRRLLLSQLQNFQSSWITKMMYSQQ